MVALVTSSWTPYFPQEVDLSLFLLQEALPNHSCPDPDSPQLRLSERLPCRSAPAVWDH